jgi:hypothetical protein
MKQSPAQSTPCPQPRNVHRDPGLIDAVWRVLQVNKSTALEAERLAILETEKRDAELSRAAARLQDVEAATRFLSEKQARLGDEAEQEELRRRQEATRTREEGRMQIWGELLLPSGKYVGTKRRRKATKREYSKS